MRSVDQSVVRLFHLPFYARTLQQVVGEIRTVCERPAGTTRAPLVVCTPNPEQVALSATSSAFLRALQAADILLPDGQGVVWASMILGQPLPERIAGVDVVQALCALPPQVTGRIMIVGGRGYAGRFLPGGRMVAPGDSSSVLGEMDIAWIEGYRDVTGAQSSEESDVLAQIKAVAPTLLFVALGAPWQELWIARHRQALQQAGVRVVMAVGGAFDMLTGQVRRAPPLLRALGLEWAFRLVMQPWRWRRQKRLISFMGMVMRERLGRSLSSRI